MRRVSRWLSLVLPALLGGCYHLPIWQGTVTVKAMERASIAKCGTGALTVAGGQAISRPPYLQSTTTRGTMVVWGSTVEQAEVILREPGAPAPLATSPAEYAGPVERKAERLAAQHREGKELDANEIYVVRAQFSGLAATHLYCYQLVANGVPLTELAPLTTAAAPGTPDGIRFVVLGDTGTGGAAQVAIARRMSAEPFDLMLFLGDIAYPDGTASQLETRFFAIYRDFLRYVPAYPAMGNHERHTRKGAPYLEAFVLPEPERYYSFDWGDVHFVATDTTHRDAAQLAWLDADLTKNKLPWVIVYGHHPMYTNSLRGPQEGIRAAFGEIVSRHRVDLVVTGHEHQYERFRVSGVNYIVSGGGGGQLTRFFGGTLALKQATVHHFLSFAVTAKHLEMRAIDIEGKEIETLELTKDRAGEVNVKVDHEPDAKQNPVAPETKTVPDEAVHDGPDDDKDRQKVGPGGGSGSAAAPEDGGY